MHALLEAVVDLVALVSPARASAVASALRGLPNATLAPSATTLAEAPAARVAIGRVLEAWSVTAASGDEVAGMLVGASEARSRIEREQGVELVWTGPTTRFVPTRRTEQVLLELIASATTDIVLVSFVAYGVPSVVEALVDAMGRGVRLRVLIEASRAQGGTLDRDHAADMRRSVPGVQLYTWRQRVGPFVDGKVHAKIAVVDGVRAFVTSANLTGHALEKNMEAGVLLHGGSVPRTLSDHIQALMDVGVIEAL